MIERKYTHVLKSLWLFLVAGFISWFVYQKYDLIAEAIFRIPPLNILYSSAILVVAKLLLTWFMQLCLYYVGENLSFKTCYKIYHASQLAKYVPGNIWHLVSKAVFYKQKGFTTGDANRAILVENGWLVASAFAAGLILIALSDTSIIIALFHKYKFYFLLNIAILAAAAVVLSRFLKLKPLFLSISKMWKLNIGIAVLQIAIWFCLGLNFYVILHPFSTGSASLPFVMGLFAIAYSVGFVTPFAPAGVGIRETILVFGLASHIDYETTIIASAVVRIIYILMEVLLALIGFRLSPASKQPSRP